MTDIAAEARAHLFTTTTGVLGTLSQEPGLVGSPFASIVPYALDRSGAPLVLIAGIAQHTKNVRADPRVSLFLHDDDTADAQASWRITLMGTLCPVDADAVEDAHARYFARVPQADDYLQTHDFSYWRLDTVRIRFIAGFGRIHWLEPSALEVRPKAQGIGEVEDSVLAHMNADHEPAMIEMCRAFAGITPRHARLVGLETTGLLVRTDEPARLFHFPFPQPIDGTQVRAATVALLARARGNRGDG